MLMSSSSSCRLPPKRAPAPRERAAPFECGAATPRKPVVGTFLFKVSEPTCQACINQTVHWASAKTYPQ
jgi:hypothetical protein